MPITAPVTGWCRSSAGADHRLVPVTGRPLPLRWFFPVGAQGL